MTAELTPDTMRTWVAERLLGRDFLRATFSGPVRGDVPCPWVRVVLRPVELRGERQVQFSYFDPRKDITRNYRLDEVPARLDELWQYRFAAVHLTFQTEEVDLRTTKKGKVQIGRRAVTTPVAAPGAIPAEHNRVKEMPLPEGQADTLLAALGIATPDGRVKPTMRAKFTQINEFLRQLRYTLDLDGWRQSLDRTILLLDCGCGLSYLTLAAHHYLNAIVQVPARILGVDVNDEVIRKSLDRREQVGAGSIEFRTGRIGTLDVQPDIVLALHACDTATDDAIAQAIRSEARILLSVPCCHHHLNDKIRALGPAEVLRPLLRHGILQQRTADLVTDAFRALTLRLLGYRTDIIEFVSTEHTARNLMIRAVRGTTVGDGALVQEYRELKRFWGVEPYLERALGNRSSGCSQPRSEELAVARKVSCRCGASYKVTRRNAGKKEPCDECDRMVRFPEWEEEPEVEELEEVDDDRTVEDDEDEYHRKRNRGKPTTSKKQGVCYLCEEEGKGKFYTFFCGFLEEVDSKHDYWSGETTVRKTYSNVHKTGIFLCKGCAVGAWRKNFLWYVVGLSVPVVFFLILALVFGTSREAGTRTAMVPMLIVAAVFLLILLVPLYKMLVPSLERDQMEQICIGLAKREWIENNEGDSFFTVSEFRETFGRTPHEN